MGNATSLQGEDVKGEQYRINKEGGVRHVRPTKKQKELEKGSSLVIKGDPENALRMFDKERFRCLTVRLYSKSSFLN
jgi:hypothetical protein